MIHIQQRVKRRHVTPATWNGISQAAWADAAAFWHTEILPKHFTVGAYREYRYAARSKAHDRRKMRKFGHTRPLVYSGKLERQVLRMRDVRTIGGGRKGGGAVVKVSGPAYLRPNAGTSKQIDFAREIRAFSKRDQKAIAVRLDKALQRGIREARTTEEEVRA